MILCREGYSYLPAVGKVFRAVKAGLKETGKCPHKDGYLQMWFDGRSELTHRVVWFISHGYWPKEIDHVNGDRTDNRLINLREVSRTDNMHNKKCYSSSRTKIPGITWHSRDRIWTCRISHNGKRLNIGYFKDFFEACCARKSTENRHGFTKRHGSNA